MPELVAIFLVVALVVVLLWIWRRVVSPSPARFDLAGVDLDAIPCLGDEDVHSVPAPAPRAEHVERAPHDGWVHRDTNHHAADDSGGWFSFATDSDD